MMVVCNLVQVMMRRVLGKEFTADPLKEDNLKMKILMWEVEVSIAITKGEGQIEKSNQCIRCQQQLATKVY